MFPVCVLCEVYRFLCAIVLFGTFISFESEEWLILVFNLHFQCRQSDEYVQTGWIVSKQNVVACQKDISEFQ